jgi:hypothetical protein
MSLLDAAQGVWLIANRGHYTVDVLTSLMLCVVTEQNVSMGRPAGGWGARMTGARTGVLSGTKGAKGAKKQTKKKGE